MFEIFVTPSTSEVLLSISKLCSSPSYLCDNVVFHASVVVQHLSNQSNNPSAIPVLFTYLYKFTQKLYMSLLMKYIFVKVSILFNTINNFSLDTICNRLLSFIIEQGLNATQSPKDRLYPFQKFYSSNMVYTKHNFHQICSI